MMDAENVNSGQISYERASWEAQKSQVLRQMRDLIMLLNAQRSSHRASALDSKISEAIDECAQAVGQIGNRVLGLKLLETVSCTRSKLTALLKDCSGCRELSSRVGTLMSRIEDDYAFMNTTSSLVNKSLDSLANELLSIEFNWGSRTNMLSDAIETAGSVAAGVSKEVSNVASRDSLKFSCDLDARSKDLLLQADVVSNQVVKVARRCASDIDMSGARRSLDEVRDLNLLVTSQMSVLSDEVDHAKRAATSDRSSLDQLLGMIEGIERNRH